MNGEIIVFPKYAETVEEIKALKKELCELLAQRDDLLLVQCRNIEAQYMMELGNLEIALFKLQCKTLRIKRKITLIQQKLNRGEPVVVAEIEKQLDAEFEQYAGQLEEKISSLNKAISISSAEYLSPEDTAEIKRIYRKIIKNLHPDLHPQASESEIMLFYNAVAAYEAGDLETLKIIEIAMGEEEVIEASADSMKAILKECETLRASVKKVNEQISEIRNSFPYNTLEILDDEIRLQEKKMEYEEAIDRETENYKIYKARLDAMMR